MDYALTTPLSGDHNHCIAHEAVDDTLQLQWLAPSMKPNGLSRNDQEN
jgi:hypothetical protein